MTRKKFQTLRDTYLTDPVERARVDEIGRAMKVVIALGKTYDSQCTSPQTSQAAGDGTDPNLPPIADDDSLFLVTLREGIEELGGRLEVVAVFPNTTVRLIG
jgi:hypothetical protein